MANDSTYPCTVDRAAEPPGKCALTGDIDGPFIDMGFYADDVYGLADSAGLRYRIYLSLPYVKYNLARDLLGMVDPEDAPESDELAEARERAEAAELALGLVEKERVAA